jgi:hypothetical protein
VGISSSDLYTPQILASGKKAAPTRNQLRARLMLVAARQWFTHFVPSLPLGERGSGAHITS